jgi:hypothetical protein
MALGGGMVWRDDLFDRDHEIFAIERALSRTSDGHGSLVIVSGGPASAKSR